jgi:hypothetical protein
MTVVKSDAMLQHEKWIAEVVAHRPKHRREVMHIEMRNVIAVIAILAVVVIAAASMMHL